MFLLFRTPFVEKKSTNTGDGELNGDDCSVTSTYERIKQHEGSLLPLADSSKNELFSEQATTIVNTLLDSRPDHRITAEQLLTSAWLAGTEHE